MNHDFATETRLRQYLLGELDENERARLEELYFGDDQAFEELEVVEDELIDAYVAGRLTPAERKRFEDLFLSTPNRRERVAFARNLHDTVRSAAPADAPVRAARERDWRGAVIAWWRATSVPQWSMAAATVVLLVGASWLALERSRLQGEIATLQTQSSALVGRAQQLQGELNAERRRVAGPAAPAVVASFLLSPRLARDGAQGNVVRLAAGTALVRLQLELEAQTHPRYRPVLETVAGEQIWSQQAVRADVSAGVPVVTIELPASLMATRDYVLTLHGEGVGNKPEEVAAYAFRVARE